MHIIHHPSDVSGISHAGTGHIVSQRISELRLSVEEVLPDIGEFIIVEPGDTISDLEEASGCVITTDLFGEDHYGAPDFVPNHEWLGNTPEKEWSSKVEFSHNVYGGGSNEEITIHGQSDHQYFEAGGGWHAGSGALP